MFAKGRNPVLLSDGTCNSAAKMFRTNIWRLYEALDLSPGSNQVAFYDGVGTSPFRPLAILSGALGVGLKRNVKQLYTYLCRNHEPGDRIYAFGLSIGKIKPLFTRAHLPAPPRTSPVSPLGSLPSRTHTPAAGELGRPPGRPRAG